MSVGKLYPNGKVNNQFPILKKIVALSELFGVTTDYLLKSGSPSFELNHKDNNLTEELPILSDQQEQGYLTAAQKSASD